MKYPFEKTGSLIIITMKLEHGNKTADVEVALDTGAVTTIINSSIAEYLGCISSCFSKEETYSNS